MPFYSISLRRENKQTNKHITMEVTISRNDHPYLSDKYPGAQFGPMRYPLGDWTPLWKNDHVLDPLRSIQVKINNPMNYT